MPNTRRTLGLVTTLALSGLALSGPALAAGPCGDKQAAGPQSSKVDPASTSKVTPGAKAESPGTVGAMTSAEGGSFTADGKPQTPGSSMQHDGPAKDGC